MGNYIRLHKTPKNQRNTYKVIDEQGNVVCEICPGEDGITEEDIHNCHKVDDIEVYENVRCFCPVYQDWIQTSVDVWRAKRRKDFTAKAKRQPMRGEVEDFDFLISLDACMDKNGEKSEGTQASETLLSQRETLPLEVEYLREVVANFSPAWQKIYQAVLLDGVSMSEVARHRGVTEGAVRKVVKKIKRCLYENADLKEIFNGKADIIFVSDRQFYYLIIRADFCSLEFEPRKNLA